MYVITGATGQLGRIVIEKLLETEAPGQIIAAVRNPAKAADLAGRGVQVREADYNRPETLEAAFVAADRLLLISSSEVDGRLPQHRAVIEAARRAGVALIAYTSMLRGDTSPAKLAREHRETEQLLFASNVPSVVLRNGWYTENHLLALRPALQAGAFIGAAAMAGSRRQHAPTMPRPPPLLCGTARRAGFTNWPAMPPLASRNWRPKCRGSWVGRSDTRISAKRVMNELWCRPGFRR